MKRFVLLVFSIIITAVYVEAEPEPIDQAGKITWCVLI